MLDEKRATFATKDGSPITLAYERRGDPRDPPVLLVMGVANQLVHWPDGFLDALVTRRLQVIRFDNRDSGRSTHRSAAPPPNLPAALAGDLASASYTLSDMADDGVGLLDALGIEAAHVLGVSMGGGIAQTMAIEHPTRVLSLSSMMFTTGHPSVGQARPATLAALFGGPSATTRDEVVARAVRAVEAVGSPAYPSDLARVAETAGIAFDRDYDPVAIARQAVATVASGDRTARLAAVAAPTLVVHGTSDGLVDVSGGRATAAAIPGAELVEIEGMGHNLPPGLWERIAELVANVVARGEERARSRSLSSSL